MPSVGPDNQDTLEKLEVRRSTKRGSSSPVSSLNPKSSESPSPFSAQMNAQTDHKIQKELNGGSCMESPSSSPKRSSLSRRSGNHRFSLSSDVFESVVDEHYNSLQRSKECFPDTASNVSPCSSARSSESRKTRETSVVERRKSFSQAPLKVPINTTRRLSTGSLGQQKHSACRVSHNAPRTTSIVTSQKTMDDGSETGSTDGTDIRIHRTILRSHEMPPRCASDKSLSMQAICSRRKSRDDQENDSFPIPENDIQFNPENPDVGFLLLGMAQSFHISGENPFKARHYALKAAEFFENFTVANVSLELVISLHLLATTCCKLGQYEEAIAVLKRSLAIHSSEMDPEHAFAAFAGYMQLGDTYSLLGQYENALIYYDAGLEIQKQVLGEMDPQVAETCRYIAESHLQAMQFREAEELCEHALKIHREHSATGSDQEASDRRLMALILAGKGDHEAALENLFLASVVLLANGKEIEAAFVDAGIGDSYLALGRYEEAVSAYHKAFSVFKSVHGEGHTTVASVYVSLAELYLETGKFKEAKTHCENALRIYGKHGAGHSHDEIATGLTEIARLFESMGEHKQALRLLQRALEIVENTPGQQAAVAGIEAQMGVLFHMTGKYEEAYLILKSAVAKLRFRAQKKTWLLGMLLNQMGLACLGLNAIWDAADNFEEARSIITEICGPHHADALAISSNLAGTYDAMGRIDDAISLLEHVLEVKEDRLGTMHPDVEDERQWLMELLQETGRSRARKTNTLQDLLFLPTADNSRFQRNGPQLNNCSWLDN